MSLSHGNGSSNAPQASGEGELVSEAMKHFAPAIVEPTDIEGFLQWAGRRQLSSVEISRALVELESSGFAIKVGKGWQLRSAARS
jgi:hypothetical protein